MKQYCLLFCVAMLLTSCITFQDSDTSSHYSMNSSFPMGKGDLDSSRKSGAYYTKLNAERNKHLPKAKPYKVRGETYVPYASAQNFEEIGIASWYGPGFHGKLTANGEKYNQNGISAAHKLLPFGTMLRVTNLENGRSIVLRVNDRGPFLHDRIIDLSKGAAKQIGMLDTGTAKVHIVVAGSSQELKNYSPYNASTNTDTQNSTFLSDIKGKISDFTSSVGTFFTGASATASGTGVSTAVYASNTVIAGSNASSAHAYSTQNTGNFGLPAGEINRYGQVVTSVYDSVYGARSNAVPGTINRYGTVGNSAYNSAYGTQNPATQANTTNINTYAPSQNSFMPQNSSRPQNSYGIDLESKSDFYSTNPNEFGDDPTYYNSNESSAHHQTQIYADPKLAQQQPVAQNTIRHNNTGTIGNFYVQVAAFSGKNNAEALLKALKKQGMKAQILHDNGKYFVQVGPFSQNGQAEQVQKRLRTEYPRAFLVNR